MPALLQRLRGWTEYELARVRLTSTARRVAGERLTYLPHHDYAGARKATDAFLAAHPMAVVTDRAHLILRR